MNVDMKTIVAEYLADPKLTCISLAARYEGLKAQEIATILRLNNVSLRKGNPKAFEATREKGLATRRANGLKRRVRELCEDHGAEAVLRVLQEIHDEREANVE
jgi:hypothetical protein